MNELIPTDRSMQPIDPAAIAAGEAAKARIQSAYLVALHRPRNTDQARDRILNACKRPAFAEKVEFAKPVGGKQVKGPSIRFAEVALKEWGNVLTETAVVYEDENIRRVKVFCTDLETNVTHSKEIVIQKTIERKKPSEDREIISERTTSQGTKVYILKTTEDEMHNKEAALISKALRNEGLRLIPSDVIDDAIEAAHKTLRDRDSKDPSTAKKKILDSFSEIGIQPRDIEQYLGHRTEMINPSEIENLRGIYRAIKDGEARWSDYVSGERDIGPPVPIDTSAFDKLVSDLNVDPEKVNLFLSKVSEINGKPIDHVKVEAVPRFKEFWESFMKWASKQSQDAPPQTGPVPEPKNQMAPPEEEHNPPITEAEALEQAKKMGMVQNEKQDQPRNDDKTIADAKLLNEYAATIAQLKGKAEVRKWYESNKDEFKKNHSDFIFWEISKLVNDKLAKYK